MALSPEKMKEILEKVKKPSVESAPEVNHKKEAQKAATKRLFAALDKKSEDEFLSAWSDLGTISEDED